MQMQELIWRLKTIKLTDLLIGINVLIFALSFLLELLVGPIALIMFGADFLPNFLRGAIWIPVTSSFLHGNLLHLLVNMFALYYIGDVVEKYYGKQALIIAYVMTGIAGSLFSLISAFVSFSAAGSISSSVGASGAIFGLVGLLLGTSYINNRYGSLPVNESQLLLLAGFNLLIGFIFPFIDNAAHIGGLLAGVGLSYLIYPINTFIGDERREKLIKWLGRSSWAVIPLAFLCQIVFTIINLPNFFT